MGLISGSVSSLVNGVSQQPDWLRLPSQGAVQENFMSSLVDGVTRRHPSEHLARISATPFGEAHLHTINNSASERYSVVITNGNLKVFDLNDGSQKTVLFPHGAAYLNCGPYNAHEAFTCTTIADFTFITNRTVLVQAENANEGHSNAMYVYVREGRYNCNYTVYIDGALQASYTTPATGNQPQTDAIATQLTSTLNTNLGANWSVARTGSVISIYHHAAPSTVHQIATYDSAGDTALTGWSKQITRFEDLPRVTFDGTIVEITGSDNNAFDSYWVEYDASTGQWIETYKPSDRERPMIGTMPHKLVNNLDGTFTFDYITNWQWRSAGDAETNLSPSFIDNYINDVMIWRNRLILLADQNAIGSRSGGMNFFDFYNNTATTQLDTDPVDVAINGSGSKVPIARYGIPYGSDLMVFSEPGQFRLGSADQALTATTIRADQAGEYTSILSARPASNGKMIHFAIEKGGESGVREGLVDESNENFVAQDVTIHVPHFIQGTITKLMSVSNRDQLYVLADGEPNAVYVYTWYIENDEKLQSSWSKWVFPTDDYIVDVAYSEGELILIIERSTGVFLERVRLDQTFVDNGLEFDVHLDRKVSVTGVYDAGNNWTTWTLPYNITGLTMVGVFGADFTGKAGFQIANLTVVNAAAGTVRVLGRNHSTGPCYFGVNYTSRYRLSNIYYRPNEGKGTAAITDGRLQLRTVFFNHSNSGHYDVTVTTPGRDPKVYTFSPNRVGSTTLVGGVVLDTGRFRVPARGRNTHTIIEVTSDNHFPCSILSFDWEGEFTLRSQKA